MRRCHTETTDLVWMWTTCSRAEWQWTVSAGPLMETRIQKDAGEAISSVVVVVVVVLAAGTPVVACVLRCRQDRTDQRLFLPSLPSSCCEDAVVDPRVPRPSVPQDRQPRSSDGRT